jgi:hypothetical protein
VLLQSGHFDVLSKNPQARRILLEENYLGSATA